MASHWPSHWINRRDFLRRAAAAAGTAAVAGSLASPALAAPKRKSPGEKLNLGVIGVAGRGGSNLKGVASENIVALCDIDEQRLDAAAAQFPHAQKFVDFRKLLDLKDLDAVVVSTPDHMHAIPAAHALKRGLDVYCEKPLTHSVWEARQVRELAASHKAVTQMGTQIHAGDNYRRVVEAVQGGVLGPVERVHVWNGGRVDPGQRVAKGKAPEHVHYDLWVGPAPMRPFHESHFHFQWRFWWDFGNGALGDFGCHYMDLPFWALDLRYPTSVAATGRKTYEGDNEQPNELQVDYHFPARGEKPAVHLTWYHGEQSRPAWAKEYGPTSAVLFEGQRGRLLSTYTTHEYFMDEGLSAETPEPSIPASIGHHAEWIEAIKSRGPTTCNFDYSGALTEAVLLGNVSYRAGQQKLEWDAESLRATNLPQADQYIRREYREGWTL